MSYIQSGKEAGAKIVTGGQRIADGGFFIQPTIFTDVKTDMKIVQEEIFGPVGVVVKFKTDEEALQMANDTTYGLAACIYTTNINRATLFANKLEAGSVFVRMLCTCSRA